MQVASSFLWQSAVWATDLPVCAGSSLTFSPFAQEGFNLAQHVEDDFVRVNHHREKLAQFTGLNGSWMWLDQHHSADVISDESYFPKCSGDAIISRDVKKIAVVMTADCVPILLSSDNGKEFAAVHAGWPGLFKGILANTLAKMQTPVESVFAWIGPCIRQAYYEVDENFYQRFTNLERGYAQFFERNRAGHFLADLSGIAKYQLIKQGIINNKITDSGLCTIGNSGFFSYRRDGKRAGRIASFIGVV